MTTILVNNRMVEIEGERIGFYLLSPKWRGRKKPRPEFNAPAIVRAYTAFRWLVLGKLPEIN